jgi:hypothetical protein
MFEEMDSEVEVRSWIAQVFWSCVHMHIYSQEQFESMRKWIAYGDVSDSGLKDGNPTFWDNQCSPYWLHNCIKTVAELCWLESPFSAF